MLIFPGYLCTLHCWIPQVNIIGQIAKTIGDKRIQCGVVGLLGAVEGFSRLNKQGQTPPHSTLQMGNKSFQVGSG